MLKIVGGVEKRKKKLANKRYSDLCVSLMELTPPKLAPFLSPPSFPLMLYLVSATFHYLIGKAHHVSSEPVISNNFLPMSYGSVLKL